MDLFKPEQIRNVVLMSHTGAGKTSLTEALLFQTKKISRMGKVEEGNTASDFEPEEVKRKISISTSIIPFEWGGVKINLLDTPGYPDFAGEVKSALKVVDAAVLLVSAASGLEVGTELSWKYADQAGIPCMIFINKLDRENTDFYKTLDQIKATFGKKCVPIQAPVGAENKFQGMVDLIQSNPTTESPGVADKAASLRESMIESIAETDDDLTTKYLEGEEITEDELRHALRAGTIARKLVPVLGGAVPQAKGTSELMDAVVKYLPSPKDAEYTAAKADTKEKVPLIPEDGSSLCAFIFKTTADPYVGKLTYLRVYSGALQSDSSAWNSGRKHAERIGQLYLIRGKGQEPVSTVGPGDIGAVAKLADTGTNDTLSNREQPLLMDPIHFPNPTLSVAVYPKTKADMDKMGTALTRLIEEDHTIQVGKDPVTGETILSGMGEAHIDVTVEKIKRKFGVDVRTETPKIPYKETITVPTKSDYKHKKQTGGHGQYGHVMLQLEPLPRGTGTEFAEKVVGGSVPKNYIPAVEKGVNEALQEGVVSGYPVTDVKVTLYDGSYHAVDSSDMSFKLASSHAVKKGVNQGRPVLLEPIMDVQITVPDNFTGDVMSDLNSKRARVQGMTPGDGESIIEAQVPLAEMLKYAIDLRSITQGRGTYAMDFSHYEEVPQHIAQRIIEGSKKQE